MDVLIFNSIWTSVFKISGTYRPTSLKHFFYHGVKKVKKLIKLMYQNENTINYCTFNFLYYIIRSSLQYRFFLHSLLHCIKFLSIFKANINIPFVNLNYSDYNLCSFRGLSFTKQIFNYSLIKALIKHWTRSFSTERKHVYLFGQINSKNVINEMFN